MASPTTVNSSCEHQPMSSIRRKEVNFETWTIVNWDAEHFTILFRLRLMRFICSCPDMDTKKWPVLIFIIDFVMDIEQDLSHTVITARMHRSRVFTRVRLDCAIISRMTLTPCATCSHTRARWWERGRKFVAAYFDHLTTTLGWVHVDLNPSKRSAGTSTHEAFARGQVSSYLFVGKII